LFERLLFLLLFQSLSHLHNTCGLDEVGKVERWLLNASLSLEILPLEAPVARNRNRITSGLSGEQEEMERKRPLQ